MKTNFITGLIILFPFLGFSQGEFNNWYFGVWCSITFNSGAPVNHPPSGMFENPGSAGASVSDSAGKILFYSDGDNVFDSTNNIMPNGTGLLGGGNDHQNVFAVQNLINKNQYYLFTVGSSLEPGYQTVVGLYYSVLDMTLHGGLGNIIAGQKNIPVIAGDSAISQLTGIRHSNNKYVWVVVLNQGYHATNYQSYLIDSSGFHTTPVSSPSHFKAHINSVHSSTNMRISPDGKNLVCTDSLTQLCYFNDTTGVVTPRFIFHPYTGSTDPTYGKEFSINSHYLYVTGNNSGDTLDQYDMSSSDSLSFVQSKQKIGKGSDYNIQMAPDGKIYINDDSNINWLSVINSPSIKGAACNYQRDVFNLNGNSNYCLPQFLQRYKVYIHDSGVCQYNPVYFSGNIWPPPDSVHWNFGDPSSGSSNFSNLLTPVHIFSSAGNYTIELFVKHNDNRTDTAWKTITIIPGPLVSLGPNRTICIGDSTTFDAGACNGCTYQWKNDGTGLIVGTSRTYKTGLADIYSVIVTNSNNCTGADTVQLFTTPVPVVTNNPLSESICSGDSTYIILTSSVPGTTFHWTASLTSGNISGFSADSGLILNQILIDNLPTNGVVTYHITPKVGSCAGTPVAYQVTVTPGVPVSISISASQNNVCAGTSVTYTAVPTNGGSNPSYQWKVNGTNSGTNSTTFTYIPINGDVVTCVLTSSITACISNNPATSNGITMVVNPNHPVSVSVAASQNPVCAGNSVTFTATPTNGGVSPIYQWKVNSIGVGTNSPNYSYIPNNGDIVTCVLTSNAICPTGNPATSNTVTMTVNPNLPVSISITASSNPFCQGSAVTFTGAPVNGGVTPSFQWQVNGINVGVNGPNYSYSPTNGDVVTCDLNSSIACPIGNPATSNTITMIVNSNLPAGVTIAASTNPFCPGSPVTFTATPVNGGASPSYQWKVNGVNAGINSHTFTYNPADGDSVRCVMTSNLSCVTGNPASSAEIIMSGTLAPIVTFTACFDTITTANAKPIKLKGGIPLGGIYSGPGVNSLTGIFTPSVAGTGTKTITYSYTNVVLCTASKNIHIIVQAAPVFTCGNNLTDIRDNKVYPTVQIGSQCWLASNLNFGTILASSQDQRDNCVSEKYCYNDNPINCSNQGGLYQWDELMLYNDTPGDQGFCPPAWHIPTENDWNTLFAIYINNGFAGSPLKYSGFSGFNALLSGMRHINKSWDFQGFATFFWSSTSYGGYKAWTHGMNDPDPSVSVYPASRVNAFSVRCVHD
jgi:uncharacterized protein (TIGR02145 family)